MVTDTGADLNAYALASGSGCCGGSADTSTGTLCTVPLHDGLANVMQSFDANAYAASVRVHAVKTAAAQEQATNVSSSNLRSTSKGKAMKTIQVYDKPMCCSTGVCGPQVDPVLPRFAADLDWIKSQGHQVERFNLAQQPQAFIENKAIHELLSTEGTDCLPVVVVDGQVVSRKDYPSRDALAAWAAGTPAKQMLPVAKSAGGCCGSTGCC